MKKIFLLMLYTVALFTVASCSFFEDEKPSKRQEEVKTIVELPDSVKQKLIAQDEQMSALLNKVDTLTTELNLTKADNVELRKKIDELKSPKSTWAYFSIGAIILSIIALVLSILKSQGIKEERVCEIVKQCLDESRRIKELQVNVNNLLSTQRNNRYTQQNSVPHNLELDIQQLKKQMEPLLRSYISTQQAATQQKDQYPYAQHDSHKSKKEPEYLRTGYANINTGKFFTKILDSAQEGCVFSIKFKKPNIGEFTIISLDKIKSRNGWQEVVEYTGSIEDATSFIEENPGICEKIDGDTWQVTTPLKIKLKN